MVGKFLKILLLPIQLSIIFFVNTYSETMYNISGDKQMKETTQILISLYKKSIEDQKMLMKTKSGLEFLIAEQHMRFLYNQL